MAKLAAHTSAAPAAPAAVDVDTLIRSLLFVMVFLAVWISFHPFKSLADPLPEVTEGGDIANQIGFSAIFLILSAWTLCNEPSRLTLLLRPALIATFADAHRVKTALVCRTASAARRRMPAPNSISLTVLNRHR